MRIRLQMQDSRLQNKLQKNSVKRPLVLPGAFCIVIKKQLRYNIYVVEMIRKLDIKIRYYMRLRDDRDKG